MPEMSESDQSARSRSNGTLLKDVVSFGLAALVGGFVVQMAGKVYDVGKDFDNKYLSKDVFESEMAGLRRETGLRHEELLRRIDAVEKRVEDLPK